MQKNTTDKSKTKDFDFDFKETSEEGVFEGYASKFDIEDQSRDTVRAGAFTKTLSDRGTGMIKMLSQHNRSNIVGEWLELSEDSIGLKVKGRVFDDEPRLLKRMRAGVLSGLSIGYKTVKQTVTDAETYALDLLEIKLYEISIVTFPDLEEATITGIKEMPTVRELEQLLTRDAGLTRSEAQAVINGKGYQDVIATRDAGDDETVASLIVEAAQKMKEITHA